MEVKARRPAEVALADIPTVGEGHDHAGPAWDDLLDRHSLVRAGDHLVVRGAVWGALPSGAEEELRQWADQIEISPAGGVTEVVAMRRSGKTPPDRLWLHLALFLAALASAVVAGGFLEGADLLDTRFVQIGGAYLPMPTGLRLGELALGLPFALAFLAVLLGHEMGHYLIARRHGVAVSLPYFIPFPPYFSIVGTLGAFIRIRSPVMRRAVLFDIGIAGPIASFLLSLPLLLVGLRLSESVHFVEPGIYPFIVHFLGEPIRIGSSLVLQLAAALSVPGFEPGSAVILHPLAFAGWLGIFVTALNLIPLAQLDGGHILYAVRGRAERGFGVALIAALAALGFVWRGWWLWGAVALLLGRGRISHPPVLAGWLPVGRGRRLLAWGALALLALTFSPAPLQF